MVCVGFYIYVDFSCIFICYLKCKEGEREIEILGCWFLSLGNLDVVLVRGFIMSWLGVEIV